MHDGMLLGMSESRVIREPCDECWERAGNALYYLHICAACIHSQLATAPLLAYSPCRSAASRTRPQTAAARWWGWRGTPHLHPPGRGGWTPRAQPPGPAAAPAFGGGWGAGRGGGLGVHFFNWDDRDSPVVCRRQSSPGPADDASKITDAQSSKAFGVKYRGGP